MKKRIVIDLIEGKFDMSISGNFEDYELIGAINQALLFVSDKIVNDFHNQEKSKKSDSIEQI